MLALAYDQGGRAFDMHPNRGVVVEFHISADQAGLKSDRARVVDVW